MVGRASSAQMVRRIAAELQRDCKGSDWRGGRMKDVVGDGEKRQRISDLYERGQGARGRRQGAVSRHRSQRGAL